MRNVYFGLALLSTLVLGASPAAAEDQVILRSVIVSATTIKVSYWKNFDTCAHLKNTAGYLIHAANNYCTANQEVVLTQTPADFLPGLVPVAGQQLKLCHGNSGLCSPYVIVTASYPPTVTSVFPPESVVGSRVAVRGNYLQTVTSVRFNGVPAPLFTVSPTEISVTVPVGATTGPITVAGPSGTANSPLFYVDVITLKSIRTGSSGITTTYFKNFPPCAKLVNANSQAIHTGSFYCTTGSEITITQPASDFLSGLAPAAGQSLRLCHPNFPTSCSDPVVVTAVPEITTFSPRYTGWGSTVTISGNGFTGATSVLFNGLPASSFVFVSDSRIDATVPPQASLGPITVRTPTAALVSQILLNIFRLTSVGPPVQFADSTLTINLTSFLGTPTVKINGVSATNVVVMGASQIQVRIAPNTPAGSAIIDLRDTVKAAVHPVALTFTVLPKVTLTSFSPTSGSPGSVVTLTGTGFRPDTRVSFGAVQSATVSFTNATTMTAVVPPGAVTAPVNLSHSFGGSGGSAISATPFQIALPPAITSFSPEQEAVGAVISLVGRGFTDVTQVFFGPTLATSITVDSDTAMRATVPVGAVSGPIRVVSPAGSALSASSFIVNPLCNPVITIPGELAINALTVVNDPRTVFNPANLPGSHWSFGYLMGRMAGAAENDPLFKEKASAFVLAWLDLFRTATVAADNGAPIATRPNIVPLLISTWPRIAGTTTLDFARAPFRLLAIMNRLDLRNANQAGEGRFVFGVLTPTGLSKQFTVILEYRLPLTPALTQNAWALKWHELAAFPVGSPAHITKLQEVTDLFSSNDFAGMPNGNAINQVRTNEIDLAPLWELREFKLPAAGGNLAEVTVKQTPIFTLNNSVAVRDWILANEDAVRSGTHQIPARFATSGAPFLGGSSPMPFGFRWMTASGLNEDTRRSFSLNTCSGCHSGETNTSFLHVVPRSPTGVAPFSSFLLNDLTARATGPNGMRNLILDNNCQ